MTTLFAFLLTLFGIGNPIEGLVSQRLESWSAKDSLWKGDCWIYYHTNRHGEIDSSTTINKNLLFETARYLKPPKDLSVSSLREWNYTDRITYQYSSKKGKLPRLASWTLVTDTLVLRVDYDTISGGESYLSSTDTSRFDENGWLSYRHFARRDSSGRVKDQLMDQFFDRWIVDTMEKSYSLVNTYYDPEYGLYSDTSFRALFLGSLKQPKEILLYSKDEKDWPRLGLRSKLVDIEWKDNVDDHTWFGFLNPSRDPSYVMFFRGKHKITKTTRWTYESATRKWQSPENIEVVYGEDRKPTRLSSPNMACEREYFEDGCLRSDRTQQLTMNEGIYQTHITRESANGVLIETMYGSVSNSRMNISREPDKRLTYYYTKQGDR